MKSVAGVKAVMAMPHVYEVFSPQGNPLHRICPVEEPAKVIRDIADIRECAVAMNFETTDPTVLKSSCDKKCVRANRMF